MVGLGSLRHRGNLYFIGLVDDGRFKGGDIRLEAFLRRDYSREGSLRFSDYPGTVTKLAPKVMVTWDKQEKEDE